MENDLSDQTYVITGATSGIGLATAMELIRAGATILCIGRSSERCRSAEQRLRKINTTARARYLTGDLSIQHEVNRLADQISELLNSTGKSSLDGLVNNAGVFTYWFTLTPDGVEMQWAVNHLAPFLLTNRLLPLLENSPFARIVTVSSDSHFGGRINWDDPQLRWQYRGLQTYNNTKLANILFTLELNRRIAGSPNLRAFAADPGLVKTDIGLKGTPPLTRWIWKLRRSGGTSPEVPARGIVYLLTEPSLQNSPEIYWKNNHPKKASPKAVDSQNAKALWDLSEKMCGLKPEVIHATAQ